MEKEIKPVPLYHQIWHVAYSQHNHNNEEALHDWNFRYHIVQSGFTIFIHDFFFSQLLNTFFQAINRMSATDHDKSFERENILFFSTQSYEY